MARERERISFVHPPRKEPIQKEKRGRKAGVRRTGWKREKTYRFTDHILNSTRGACCVRACVI
jgi:hypothetical protein